MRSGPQKGTRVLEAEEDLGRALVKSLTAEQRKDAILSETAPGDIVTAAARKAAILEEKGIAYGQLTKEQQGLLLTLLQEYANVQVAEIAKQRLDAVRKAGLESVKFAWMGGLDKGSRTTTAFRARPSLSSTTTRRTTPIIFTRYGATSRATSAPTFLPCTTTPPTTTTVITHDSALLHCEQRDSAQRTMISARWMSQDSWYALTGWQVNAGKNHVQENSGLLRWF